MELHKKYMSLKFYTQKDTWHQNFLPKKNTRLKYLNAEKYVTDLDTPQNTEGVNFQPKKKCQTPSHMYCEYPPPPSLVLSL